MHEHHRTHLWPEGGRTTRKERHELRRSTSDNKVVLFFGFLAMLWLGIGFTLWDDSHNALLVVVVLTAIPLGVAAIVLHLDRQAKPSINYADPAYLAEWRRHHQ